MSGFRSASLAADLALHQNADGGWGYRSGKSWTEPTCCAILALSNAPEYSGVTAKGRRWLAACQRQDGGWAPDPQVDRSTWVTSLAVLALHLPLEHSGMRWILRETSAGSGLSERIRARFLGVAPAAKSPPAWPWFPGTAAWVIPTSISMLALRHARSPEAVERLEEGAEFLLRRRCADGGWNHGGTSAGSEIVASYPETTGVALLALRGRTGTLIEQSVARAQSLLSAPGSAEGLAWLCMGLGAHGHRQNSYTGPPFRCWTVADAALTLLSQASECPLT